MGHTDDILSEIRKTPTRTFCARPAAAQDREHPPPPPTPTRRPRKTHAYRVRDTPSDLSRGLTPPTPTSQRKSGQSRPLSRGLSARAGKLSSHEEAALTKYKFSPAERYAVYKTHGARCYLNGEPVDVASFQVDHIIPEALLDKSEQLALVLADLGLPPTFQINSFTNWMPACAPCNRKKLDSAWRPTPLILKILDDAVTKAPIAAAHAAKTLSDQRLALSLLDLERAYERGRLPPDFVERLKPLVRDFVASLPSDPKPGDELRVLPNYAVPLYKVLSDDGITEVVRGPYGVGGGPSSTSGRAIPGGMTCSCGNQWFNGGRCVICGQLLDD